MPESSWISGAQLIPENKPYKVDSAGRIAVPANLRAKFNIESGDYMDYYTTFVDGKWFLCCCLHFDDDGNKIDDKGELIIRETKK